MPRRIWILVLSALVTALCSFGATPELQFTVNAGGTYSYAGTSGDLSGSGLTISGLLAFNTPGGTDSTNYVVTDGALDFTSGDLTGTTSDTWNFGAGPTGIIITGCIAGVTGTGLGGACTVADDSATLLSDEFTNATIGLVGGIEEVEASGLEGTYLSSLASYFGVSSTFSSASQATTNINGPIVGLTPSASQSFTADNTGGAVSTFTTAAVPEDWTLSSSLGLFGFGLVAFAVARRFRLVKTVTF